MSTTEVKVKIGLEGAQQVQTGAQAAAQALQGLGQKTQAFGQGAQLTGYQTAQLSAQLQDFFIQVQGGTNPLTALAQQGSQLGAVFGGAGNALRAVVSLVTPTVAVFGAAAAAIGTLGYAFVNGAREQQAFAKAMVMTGNAAGVTSSQLNEMAKAVATFGSTRGQGADVLAQLVATGQVARTALAGAAEAAIKLERDGGVAIKDTVQAFADLGRTPLETLKKLNDTQNFLTVSTYKQVQALTEAGKAAEAARVAQEAYASASTSRMGELQAQLGTVEKSWQAIKRAVLGVGDAILNIGRPDSLQDQFAALQAKLDTAQKAPDGERSAARQKFIEDAKQRLEVLRQQIYAEQEMAQAQADGAEAAKKGIKAADDLAEARKKSAEELKRMIEAGRDLVQAEDLRSAGFDPGFLKQMQELQAYAKASGMSVERLQQAIAGLIAQQPFAQAAVKAAEDVAKSRADFRRQEEQAIASYIQQTEKEREAVLKSVRDKTQATEDEVKALGFARERNISLAEAMEMVIIKRLEDKKAGYQPGSEPYLYLEREIEARQRLLQVMGDKRVLEANQRAADEMLRAWQSVAQQVGEGLADALMQGGKSAADYLKNLFKSLVLKPIIQAAVQPYVNAVVGAVSGGTAAGGSGANLMQLGSAANTGYNLYTGSGIYGQAAAAGNYASVYSGQAYGTAFGSEQSAMLAAQESGMVSPAGGSAMSTWGAYAGYAAMIYAAAQYASSLYDKGFTGSAQLNDKWWYQLSDKNLQTKLLKGLGLSDKWAEILGGSVRWNHMFGRAAPRIEAQGITGTFGAGDFSGQAFADVVEKGGLFRSDKRYTNFAALPDDIGKFLDDASKAMLEQAQAYGAALGLPADVLKGVNQEARIELTDDAEKNKDALLKALAGYGDALVESWSDAIKPLAQYGESTAQTIERVATALGGVNDVLKALGLTAYDASVTGAGNALALQNLFGGLGNLQTAGGSFLQNFFSDQQRKDMTLGGISGALAEVGVSLPATRDAFRELVQAQDLSTEAGRKAFAVLMSVSDAFAAVVEAGRSAAEVAQERYDLETQLLQLQGDAAKLLERERAKLDPSNYDLFDAIQALKARKAEEDAAAKAADAAAAARQAEADAAASMYAEMQRQAEAARAAWAQVWGSMADQIKKLRGQDSNPAAMLAQFATATAQARSGNIEAAKLLPGLSQSLADNALATAGSRVEYDVLRAQLAASLERTMVVTGAPAETLAGLRTDIQDMRADMVDLQAQAITQAKRLADLLAKFDVDGMPPVRP